MRVAAPLVALGASTALVMPPSNRLPWNSSAGTGNRSSCMLFDLSTALCIVLLHDVPVWALQAAYFRQMTDSHNKAPALHG